MSTLKAQTLSLAAIFTALVAVATAVFQVYIPETKGYFNIGEVMIYTTALLFGPVVGCIAGGVGSALADMITGFYIYAPATLVIKGVEGYVVGYLFRKFSKPRSRAWNFLVVILLLSIFTILWFVLYSGTFTFALAWGIHRVFTISIYSTAIYLAILIMFIAVAVLLHKSGELANILISTLAGGALMVLGYYLYEQIVLGLAALAEVPFNIGQVVVGTVGAVPLYTTLRKALKGYRGVISD